MSSETIPSWRAAVSVASYTMQAFQHMLARWVSVDTGNEERVQAENIVKKFAGHDRGTALGLSLVVHLPQSTQPEGAALPLLAKLDSSFLSYSEAAHVKNTPLEASSSSAGALLSGNSFVIPQFQREYAWEEEVAEFWEDLQQAAGVNDYFLGLIILTDEDRSKQVVDGQQRLITLSLLAAALYFEAISRDREALADRIQATFLHSINYETDEVTPRVTLSSPTDNRTFQSIISTGKPPRGDLAEESVSERITKSYKFIADKLRADLKTDPFRRLGRWAEFLTENLYFAVFVHPDRGSAYQVYEVINTRGRDLTTADLLKSYVLSQTAADERDTRYAEWQEIASRLSADGNNNFVQYIRDGVTVKKGHILPKNLFKFLAGRDDRKDRSPPTVPELMNILRAYLPYYEQMVDPTVPGPASTEQLAIFSALNSLGVIALRPVLLAIAETDDVTEGMRFVLRLVVRRIVVGNLGTGNVARRFGEAANKVHMSGDWRILQRDLADLNPSRDEFRERLARRSFNKATLGFLRRSVIEGTITPDTVGQIELIWNRQATQWPELPEEDGSFWGSSIGNSILIDRSAQIRAANSWHDFKTRILVSAMPGEFVGNFSAEEKWTSGSISRAGQMMADRAVDIWY